MFKGTIIPVQMKKVRDPKGKEVLKATVPMNLIFEKGFDANWLEEELTKFERRYFYLLTCLESLLESIRSKVHKDRKVLLYWEFGDKILEFVDQDKNSPLFLESLTKSLRRDINVSDKIIMRCKRFRVLYPDVTKIDQSRSFDSYVASFEGGYITGKKRDKKVKGKK